MRTLSVDRRQRIVDSHDKDEGTRAEIARRFRVSLGMVKKLLQQRRHTGDLAPRHRFAGRKPMIVGSHRTRIRALLARKNDLTLGELREALGLACSVQALHVVLGKMGLTYKKRRSMPVSKTAPTLRRRGGAGARRSGAGLRPG